MQKSAKRWKIRESDFDVFWRVCQGLSPCKIFWKSVNRRLRNSMLKKRTFFVSRFLLERIGGFLQKIFQTYLGTQKKTIFICFALGALVQKLQLFSWKFAKFFFHFFWFFWRKTWKSAKNFFLKFLALVETVHPHITFFAVSLTVFATSCKIEIVWLKLLVPQSDPSHLHDHGFLLRLAALGFFQKPLIKT